MEGLLYEDVKYRNFYARTMLSSIGIEVFDPIIKEKHVPGRIISLKNCGIKPEIVLRMDLGAVEKADIIFWITGDKASEGCVSEVTWAACLNEYAGKKFREKLIVIVSPTRHKSTPIKERKVHFTSLHKNTIIVKTIDEGIQVIRKRMKL
jgi:hypothetical protein